MHVFYMHISTGAESLPRTVQTVHSHRPAHGHLRWYTKVEGKQGPRNKLQEGGLQICSGVGGFVIREGTPYPESQTIDNRKCPHTVQGGTFPMPHLCESEGVQGVGQHEGVMAVKQGRASMCSLEDLK